MAAAIDAANARPEVLVLTLTEGNESALRLYRSVGFEVWGTQPVAIRTECGFKGKVHMSRTLQPPTAAVRPNTANLENEGSTRRPQAG